MKKTRRGFTLVEVALFLAVTTALFVGIAAATQNSIFQQRYNDSVQNFAEFLRSVYSQVSNVQNEKTGRSDKAIYGKVVTFSVNDDGSNHIKSYNLIGDVEHRDIIDETPAINCEGSSSVLSRLGCLSANVVLEDETTANQYRTVGFVEDYIMRWAASLQTTDAWNPSVPRNGYQPFQGILVITHSPNSGNIFTYVMRANPDDSERQAIIDKIISDIEACGDDGICDTPNPFVYKDPETALDATYFTSQFFDNEDIDFCINPNGDEHSLLRRNVRITSGAHNASGVQVVTDDQASEQNNWQGNRCQ